MKKWSTFVVGTLDMTPEGLGEMFEGFSAETNTRKMSARINGALSGGSCMRTPGSEDLYCRFSAETCGENFHLRQWGAERRVLHAQTRERGTTLS